MQSWANVVKTLLALEADLDVRAENDATVLWTLLSRCEPPISSDIVKLVEELVVSNPALEVSATIQISEQWNVPVEYHNRTVSLLCLTVLQQSSELVNLFLTTGYDMRNEDMAQYPTKECYKELVDIVTHAPKIQRLDGLCRHVLRTTYSGRLLYKFMDSVKYPESLKRFVLVQDVCSGWQVQGLDPVDSVDE
jgi:hypothetical protein